MKNWKALIAGFLVLCLCAMTPFSAVFAEEEGEYQETEEPIPDSYYYEIESNGIQGWPQGPAIESAAATVMDMDTKTFLYSKQATEKMYPASTTKIMTTLLLLEHCDLDDTITFSEIVYDLEEGSSHLGIQPGEEMTIRDAAYGIMLASANDISNGIAEYIGGSLSGFAEIMNEKAAELGCVNTHFSNPHGLYSDDHYTCAYDMALIASAAYENDMFREIVSTKEYTIPETNLVEEQRSFLNHHKMLQSDSDYYREWCTGGKTGFTSQCLNTLVTFGERDEKRFVSVVFRVNGAGKAYNESTQILDYAFENFGRKNYEKIDSKESFYDIMRLSYLGKAALFQSPVWMDTPVKTSSVNLILPNGASIEDLDYNLVQENGNEKIISYEYNGQTVGGARGEFRTVFAPAQFVFEKEPTVQSIEDSLDTDIQIESLDEVLTQTAAIFNTGYQLVQDYAENHFVVVAAGSIILLILLIVFIIVLFFRLSADARIQKRRKQEEQERKRREEEIERMTTAEIEAELRAVMEQEKIRKEREKQAQAEAERAAEEARRIEEEAHETERLLEELERERQERLASQKGDK